MRHLPKRQNLFHLTSIIHSLVGAQYLLLLQNSYQRSNLLAGTITGIETASNQSACWQDFTTIAENPRKRVFNGVY